MTIATKGFALIYPEPPALPRWQQRLPLVVGYATGFIALWLVPMLAHQINLPLAWLIYGLFGRFFWATLIGCAANWLAGFVIDWINEPSR